LKQRLSWQHVWLEAWQSILALFLVYAVTLSLFPGVLAEDLKVGHDVFQPMLLRLWLWFGTCCIHACCFSAHQRLCRSVVIHHA
jgi:hypothetical protein